ncbi:MAG: AAA family ATPase [Rubripirellula sp.]
MTTSRILVHRRDENLDDEVRAAVAGITNLNASLHFHSDLRSTINAATSYQPNLVVIELNESLDQVKTVVEETLAAVPTAIILGVYDATQITQHMDESALMLQALRIGVEDFIRRPIATPDFEQVLKNRLNPRRGRGTAPGKLACFISNKGGVGKSTCAVNTAVGLAINHSNRVALIDCSLQMGVCAVQLNLQPEATLVDAWNERDRLDEQLLRQLMTEHESGLHVMCAPPSAIEAAEIDDAFLSRVLLMARRTYDYVIIDTFPMFDRTVMTILDLCDQSYIVVENVVPTLQTVKGFFTLLEEFSIPLEQQRIVLNRYSSKSGSPKSSDVSQYLGREADYIIPSDHGFIAAANTGEPFITKAGRWNRSALALKQLAKDLTSSTGHQRQRIQEHPPTSLSENSTADSVNGSR